MAGVICCTLVLGVVRLREAVILGAILDLTAVALTGVELLVLKATSDRFVGIVDITSDDDAG